MSKPPHFIVDSSVILFADYKPITLNTLSTSTNRFFSRVDSAPSQTQTIFHRCVFLSLSTTHCTSVLSFDGVEGGKWFPGNFREQLVHPCHIVMWRIAEGHLNSLGLYVCELFIEDEIWWHFHTLREQERVMSLSVFFLIGGVNLNVWFFCLQVWKKQLFSF